MEVRQNTEKEMANLGIGTVDLKSSPDCGICHDIIIFARERWWWSIVVGFTVLWFNVVPRNVPEFLHALTLSPGSPSPLYPQPLPLLHLTIIKR